MERQETEKALCNRRCGGRHSGRSSIRFCRFCHINPSLPQKQPFAATLTTLWPYMPRTLYSRGVAPSGAIVLGISSRRGIGHCLNPVHCSRCVFPGINISVFAEIYRRGYAVLYAIWPWIGLLPPMNTKL